MSNVLVWLSLLFCVQTFCLDSNSFEINSLEKSTHYEPIIISDIAEIINDFESNANFANDEIASESESNENIEDLLLEYQHYLEKAQKQRKVYLEKSKSKNKVPMLKHERFSKLNPYAASINEYSNNNQKYYNAQKQEKLTPMDIFMPITSKLKFFNLLPITTTRPRMYKEYDAYKINNQNRDIASFPITNQKFGYDKFRSPCFCKNNEIPCECNCKQCLIPIEIPFLKNLSENDTPLSSQRMSVIRNNTRKFDYYDNTNNAIPNIFNIRIKLDIQLPNAQFSTDHCKNHSCDRTMEKNEVSLETLTPAPLNLPFSYFNFPIPLGQIGYHNNVLRQESSPIHKIVIHKKKKTRNNNGKKHRKKLLALPNLKLESLPPLEHNFEESFLRNDSSIIHNNSAYEKNNAINNTQATTFDQIYLNATREIAAIQETSTSTTTFTKLVSKDIVREDNHKNGNSIETEFTKINSTTEAIPLIRHKRDTIKEHSIRPNKTIHDENYKNKGITESDLLYWASNSNATLVNTKNITALILEREQKKIKLNISGETIKRNHTKALEQAIFGEVDWNDVNAIAPIFISFVGKYVRGVLTFCSDTMCHSMKCAEKMCIHRTCAPHERTNNRGHCSGSQRTDSVASMESIMDLPTKIVFEIVDILQERMLGKLFGKVTLCITSKCISFITSKKLFIKSKCTFKQLDTLGHCSNMKNVKTV